MIEFAKKTGDYAVLSHADLCVLALTYAVNEETKAEEQHRTDFPMVHLHVICQTDSPSY